MNLFRLFLTEASTEAQSDLSGGMDSMVDMLDMLMLIMLLGFGIYAIYSAIRLYKEQLLFPSKVLYPGNCPPEDCVLEGEFIDFMVPRALTFGIALFLMGVAMGLNMYVFEINALWVDLCSIVLPVGAIIVYVVMQRKAAKLFWNVALPEEDEGAGEK